MLKNAAVPGGYEVCRTGIQICFNVPCKTESYQEAIAGYENIMNNHPDEIVRLNASWDRSAVVLLMGQGGSESNLQINSYKLRIKRLLDKNPAHKIAKKYFLKQRKH